MIRKVIAVLVLVPLMIAIVALALVNRHGVPISLDPFSAGDLTNAVQVPLFVLVFGLVAGGVFVGGVAAWLNQGKWRRAARRAEWELGSARAEIAELKQRLADAEDEGRRWPPRALQRPAA
jgi:Na+/glutamate symporter